MMIAQHKPFDFEKSTWSVSNQHNSLPLTTDAAVSIMSQNNLLSGCDMVKGGKPIVSNCISCVSPNPDTNSSIPPPFHIASDGRKLFRSACKARNVGPDHNEHTAYLLVPEDAPHDAVIPPASAPDDSFAIASFAVEWRQEETSTIGMIMALSNMRHLAAPFCLRLLLLPHARRLPTAGCPCLMTMTKGA